MENTTDAKSREFAEIRQRALWRMLIYRKRPREWRPWRWHWDLIEDAILGALIRFCIVVLIPLMLVSAACGIAVLVLDPNNGGFCG